MSSADEPIADGVGEQKPVINRDDAGNNNKPHGQQCRFKLLPKKYPKRERFAGAHPDLQGHILTRSTTCQSHIHINCFNETDKRTKALIGQKYDLMS